MDNRIKAIEGWIEDPELEWLIDTAQTMRDDALIVELGAWKGKSTTAIAKSIPKNATLVTVDTWLGQPDLRITAHREAIENDIFLIFLDNMKIFDIDVSWYTGQSSGLYYLRMESTLAPIFFKNNSIDWIFIDCDHTKFGEDIDSWYRKIKPRGIISGHDYQWGGAKDAIDDRIVVKDVINSVWWGQKD